MKTWFPAFLIAVVLILVQDIAEAEQAAKAPRIGYLSVNDPTSPFFESFRQGLRELGHLEGQNIIIEPRILEGQFRDPAAELAGLKMDVIVAQAPAIRAAMGATKTVPIVATFESDPVRLGFVASLERPGGNVTGVGGLNLELGGKWLELIKETVPSAKRVAVFWNKPAEDMFPVWKSVEWAANSLGVEIQWLQAGVGGFGFLFRNLRLAAWKQADAFIVMPGLVGSNLEAIAEFGVRNRIPGIFWRTDIVQDQAGGLMAYSVNRLEQSRRAAYFVDRILKGAKPAELPVELPKSFELVINLKTAREIGITIPRRVLAWADRVIK